MNIKQMSRFLREVHWAKKHGWDVGAVIRRYHGWYKNVYIYNDFCIKHILTGGGKDLTLATNLVNAALHLTGCECISNPKLENPAISGGLVHKDIEQDILISHQRPGRQGDEPTVDRIGLEFQHIGYDAYSNRLLFYVARHVGNMLKKGDFYDKMQNINIISFQMFDYRPWEVSQRYVHKAWFQDDEQNTFSKQQMLTIVEIGKFLEHANTDYAEDDSRLAQWLRAIDALNNNKDFSAFAGDKYFSLLQKRAEMSTFAKELFIKAGERMKDDVEVAAYIARSEERRKSEDVIAKLQAEIARLRELLAQKS
ncbi:MAG: Rpn family recombination-promoting nuclease/putative transposase [Fibrobacter sp.]|nr:Rpn family recombination-promoting nuclease/putative transposase [Fibrobacter sp.]